MSEPVRVLHADSRAALRELAPESIDACVTDPPYGLAFMGRAWDRPGADQPAFDPVFWRAVLRVLKPGAHLVAFSGTRTYHRMVCAIEGAGFEIRDQLAWLFGSGFPKSHDVATAIDKLDAVQAAQERRLAFTAWIRAQGLTAAQIDRLTGTHMGGHYVTTASQPAVATREHFELLRPHFRQAPPHWIERLVDERTVESENLKRRQVIGQHDKPAQAARWRADYEGGEANGPGLVTAAHTPEARAWEGWGTALKPAHEPIVLARKPLIGTVASNVLKHGAGALNIDACRIHAPDAQGGEYTVQRTAPGAQQNATGERKLAGEVYHGNQKPGRWPANVVHDGSPDVLAGFPETGVTSDHPRHNSEFESVAKGRDSPHVTHGHADNGGSAARFFYTAKADASDRLGSRHPTVKPVDLMAWLVRLVTPAGALVLDPFAGTGTTGAACVRFGPPRDPDRARSRIRRRHSPPARARARRGHPAVWRRPRVRGGGRSCAAQGAHDRPNGAQTVTGRGMSEGSETLRWYRYVPHGQVEAYRAAGWRDLGPMPGSHGVWSRLMRWPGPGAPEGARHG